MSKISDSYLEKISEAIKELYIDVKIKNNVENLEEFKKSEFEKLKEINLFTLIEYIKESMDIYVNFKIEEVKNSFRFSEFQQKVFENNEDEVYEKMIKKLEADIRNHIKVIKINFFL